MRYFSSSSEVLHCAGVVVPAIDLQKSNIHRENARSAITSLLAQDVTLIIQPSKPLDPC